MHELAVTEEILSLALSYAEKNDANKVTRICLKVGEMTQIVDDCIKFYFDAISRETIASGAQIDIEKLPLKAKCSSCDVIYQVENLDFSCPLCSIVNSDVVSGKELCLESIEIE